MCYSVLLNVKMWKLWAQGISTLNWKYRVSHETWQLVNSFECLLPWTVLDIKHFFAVYFVNKIFYSNIFHFEINFTIIWLPHNIFIILFGIKQLNKLWKKTFIKLFTNSVMFRGTPCTWHYVRNCNVILKYNF